ncbi:hypothetical protein A9974_15205 [Achromobacter sp. UMC71]|nr:hypothetical protein [Achromobacter sp. UMC71]
MRDLDARRQKAQADAGGIATKTVQEDKASTEKIAKIQEPLARAEARHTREKHAVRRTMDAWIGQPEAELLRVWGPLACRGPRILSQSPIFTPRVGAWGCRMGRLFRRRADQRCRYTRRGFP